MPAPGIQHQENITPKSPFYSSPHRISEYTPKEAAVIQASLEKQLGPEYLTSRPGAGGQKIHYITGEKCIQLANEIFGFNGWSSSIQTVQVDFVDEAVTGKDIGYGSIENTKGKAAAFEKAKKEAATDALKRALRNFGNVLGNCIYDKHYLTKVTKMKCGPSKWDVESLHRHSDYAPVKRESTAQPSDGPVKSIYPKMDIDEFGGDDFFDAEDFSETTIEDVKPDEVILEATTSSEILHPLHCVSDLPDQSRGSAPAPQISTGSNLQPPGVAVQNARTGPFNNGLPPQQRPPGGQIPPISRNPPQNFGIAQAPTLPGSRSMPQQQQQQTSRQPPHQDLKPDWKQRQIQIQQQKHQQIQQPQLQLQQQPAQPEKLRHLTPPQNPERTPSLPLSDLKNPPIGFFSAKAVDLNKGPDACPLPTAQTFNPHAESPSIRKTAGVDHTKSTHITRDLVAAVPAPPMVRTNIMNPHLDATRKIGMPGSLGPMNNRNPQGFKPHAAMLKRPLENQTSP
ncbi:MAG: DNA repair protein rad52 [Trizodia sp. TS-e1964]|nr:MAG: DNA repair protein rad52 [Trizodia sp. TS-e1964]